MGWRYVYGCNAHRGAEGDNSSAKFGISRKKCSVDGEGARWHAAISKTSPKPHHIAEATAKPPPLYHHADTAAVKVYVGAAKHRGNATLNTARWPELSTMYELSRGRLPSRRLRFHFPDLFPDIEEEEKPSKKRLHYQEPPRLVNSESALRWMVPSVPWRYQQRRNVHPLVLSGASRDDAADASPRKRLNVNATPKGLDVGCQTTADVGTQADVTHASDCLATKEVIVVESSPVDDFAVHKSESSAQTDWSFLRERTARKKKKKAKTKKVTRSSPIRRPSSTLTLESSVPAARASTQTPNEDASKGAHGAETPARSNAEEHAANERSPHSVSSSAIEKTTPGFPLKRQDCLNNEFRNASPRKYPQSVVAENIKPESARVLSPKPLRYQLKITSTPEVKFKESAEPRDKSPSTSKRERSRYSRMNSLPEKEMLSILEPSIHSNTEAMTSMSMASSLGSLEELEQLIESQHAQLVAKGLLPPESELEQQDSEEGKSLPPREATPSTETETRGRGEEAVSRSHSFSFDDSLGESSLSEMLEHLGVNSSDIPIVHLSTDSSEIEKSTAAALAALTRFQSQGDSTDGVYDVCISKES